MKARQSSHTRYLGLLLFAVATAPAASAAPATPPCASGSTVFDIATDCGAVGDNATMNTAAIQACFDRASAAGPGSVVVVPPGVFLTGTTSLSSGTTLRFSTGGWLQASSDPSDYSADWDYWHAVQAVNASDVALCADSRGGGGIVGAMWQMVASYSAAQQMWTPRSWAGVGGCVGECRPKNLAFIDVRGLSVVGVALRYSSDWTLLLRRCHDALLDGLVIEGSRAWPNGDGMDIESGGNISLVNLNISTGDDAIAMRSGNCNALRTPWPAPLQPLSGVRVANCTLASSSAAIKIENLFQADHGNVSDIAISDVTIVDSNRGIGIWQRVAGPSGGWMGNISVQRATIATRFMFGSAWWGSGEGIVVTSVPENAAQAATGLPGIHNVSFEDVTIVADNGMLFSSRGQETTNPRAIDGLTLRNVSLLITRAEGDTSTWAQRDFRPIDEGGSAPNTVPALVDGIVFENVAGADLVDVYVAFDAARRQPYWDGVNNAGVCVNTTQSSPNVNASGVTCALALAKDDLFLRGGRGERGR